MLQFRAAAADVTPSATGEGAHTKALFKSVLFLFAAFITVEVGARVYDSIRYGAPLLGPYTMDSIFEFHKGVKTPRPFGRYRTWALNSMGIRGPELRSGVETIVCIGASETFGTQESAGAEYPRQLERELNRRAGQPAYQVANLGYPGMTLPSAMRILPSILDHIRPRWAIVYPTPAHYIYRVKEDPGHQDRPPGFELRSAERIRDRLKPVLPLRMDEWLRRGEIERIVAKLGTEMDRVPEERIRFCEGDLRKFIAVLRERGIEPVLVTHVMRFRGSLSEQDRHYLLMWRRFYPVLKEEGLLDVNARVNDIVRRVAREERAALIDAAEVMPGGERYFQDYLHFRDEGAAVFASILADGLVPAVPGALARASP